MISLVNYISEACCKGKKCRKLDKKVLKQIKDGTYKADKKFIDFLKKNVKESLNESEDNEQLISDFRTWVMDSIDSWIQAADDDDEDMEGLAWSLDTADDYFSNEYEIFLDEYGYDESTEWLDEFNDIIDDYVNSSRDYLEEKYDHWNG